MRWSRLHTTLYFDRESPRQYTGGCSNDCSAHGHQAHGSVAVVQLHHAGIRSPPAIIGEARVGLRPIVVCREPAAEAVRENLV